MEKTGNPVPATVRLVKQLGDIYSLGKNLKRIQIANYVKNKIASKSLPLDSSGVYLVLTAKDALVAPNGVGADGMVINIATILAGAATNPFKTG
ncbi:hypothetical protein Pint_00928 [Pistacia integerrima]|uniref:Uncharacterized protein n=1 Tax=Pistacia integerrima TaxID=434235 RepID=A0ACC0ZQ58_9ROSI|nr:hypothetical protein Pint_00928 [Pistacia integerrima]